MDNDNKYQNTENSDMNKFLQDPKVQSDLFKLIKVLGACIESADDFYCYTRKKQMLNLSNDN